MKDIASRYIVARQLSESKSLATLRRKFCFPKNKFRNHGTKHRPQINTSPRVGSNNNAGDIISGVSQVPSSGKFTNQLLLIVSELNLLHT